MKFEQNPKIEELLNSYIDDELSADERSEVQRLVRENHTIAQRLRQLERCKAMVSSLPPAEPPAQVVADADGNEPQAHHHPYHARRRQLGHGAQAHRAEAQLADGVEQVGEHQPPGRSQAAPHGHGGPARGCRGGCRVVCGPHD